MSTGSCCRPIISISTLNLRTKNLGFASRTRRGAVGLGNHVVTKKCVVRAAVMDSYESSSNLHNRMERAWLISQQPTPVACSSCYSNGHVECKWCNGTGFFILGDNMLCQVPSRNSTCVICAGKGSMRCSDCKGTGQRAKWLGEPPIPS